MARVPISVPPEAIALARDAFRVLFDLQRAWPTEIVPSGARRAAKFLRSARADIRIAIRQLADAERLCRQAK
jgi:hypothetical protein